MGQELKYSFNLRKIARKGYGLKSLIYPIEEFVSLGWPQITKTTVLEPKESCIAECLL